MKTQTHKAKSMKRRNIQHTESKGLFFAVIGAYAYHIWRNSGIKGILSLVHKPTCPYFYLARDLKTLKRDIIKAGPEKYCVRQELLIIRFGGPRADLFAYAAAKFYDHIVPTKARSSISLIDSESLLAYVALKNGKIVEWKQGRVWESEREKAIPMDGKLASLKAGAIA